jgi:O6-methylguanine-DNA--protein-cysteine methyltransferase
MAKIPVNTTINYAAFAAIAGDPKATRAAGPACATNKSG